MLMTIAPSEAEAGKLGAKVSFHLLTRGRVKQKLS